MKYYESRFSKFVGSAGFYVIIAVCLVSIGAASWFAISRYNAAQLPDVSSGSSTPPSAPQKSIPDVTEPSQPVTPSQPDAVGAEKTVSDEPYTPTAPAAKVFQAPVAGEILKNFSDSELQYSATYGDMRLHNGTDIACQTGTEIMSAGDGTVLSVDDSSSFGKIVRIDHGNGIQVSYCGLDGIKVSAGQTVALGDILGISAEIPSECADASHIHIEVTLNGVTVSPFDAMKIN